MITRGEEERWTSERSYLSRKLMTMLLRCCDCDPDYDLDLDSYRIDSNRIALLHPTSRCSTQDRS